MKIILILTALTLFTACSTASTYVPRGPVTIGVRCPNGGCGEPIAAANQYLAKYQIQMVEHHSGRLALVMARDIRAICQSDHPALGGCALNGTPVVYLNFAVPEMWGANLLHEMGHTVGFSHQSAGLMSASDPDARRIPLGYLDAITAEYGETYAR